MQNSEPNIYAALATIRNGYMQMQWSRVQMYLVFNTVALPIAFRSGEETVTSLLIGAVGIFVSVFIPIAIVRGNSWSKYFSGKMAEIEALDAGTDRAPRVTPFLDEKYRDYSRRRYASRRLFAPVATVLLVVWLWFTATKVTILVSQHYP